MNLDAALKLGRVSNLPTIWTNVLAGIALSGAVPGAGAMIGLVLSMSLFYLAGMFLNDAFDSRYDAQHRPERPIPSGQIDAGSVYRWGFGLLAAALLLLALIVALTEVPNSLALVLGALLAGCIVAYDWRHKESAIAPILMGICRALVYLTVAVVSAGGLNSMVLLCSAALTLYVAGITYVAKIEEFNRIEASWPLGFLILPLLFLMFCAMDDAFTTYIYLVFLVWVIFSLVWLMPVKGRMVGRTVSFLIAGICLLDGVILATYANPVPAAVALTFFMMTFLLQKHVPGT